MFGKGKRGKMSGGLGWGMSVCGHLEGAKIVPTRLGRRSMVWREIHERSFAGLELYSNIVVLAFYELDDHYEYYSHLLSYTLSFECLVSFCMLFLQHSLFS